MNDNQRREIWKLRSDGLGYGAIAQLLNLSLGSVKQYCRRFPELKGPGKLVKTQIDEGSDCTVKIACKSFIMLIKVGRKSSALISVVKFIGTLIKRNMIKPKLHMMN